MTSPGKVALISLTTFVDRRGKLTSVEKEPFDIKRAFWLWDVKEKRGGHGHEVCHQLIIPIHGEAWVSAGDWQGWLSKPNEGLYVPPGNVIDIYANGATLLILCSDYYDPKEYTYLKGESGK